MDLFDYHDGPALPARQVRGIPGSIRVAEVAKVTGDTIDVRPLRSRAGKIGVPYPTSYTPAEGDWVLITDESGDPRTPICIGLFRTA